MRKVSKSILVFALIGVMTIAMVACTSKGKEPAAEQNQQETTQPAAPDAENQNQDAKEGGQKQEGGQTQEEDSKAKDSKTTDSKAKDNKAKDSKAKDNKAKDSKAKDSKAKDSKTKDSKKQ